MIINFLLQVLKILLRYAAKKSQTAIFHLFFRKTPEKHLSFLWSVDENMPLKEIKILSFVYSRNSRTRTTTKVQGHILLKIGAFLPLHCPATSNAQLQTIPTSPHVNFSSYKDFFLHRKSPSSRKTWPRIPPFKYQVSGPRMRMWKRESNLKGGRLKSKTCSPLCVASSRSVALSLCYCSKLKISPFKSLGEGTFLGMMDM